MSRLNRLAALAERHEGAPHRHQRRPLPHARAPAPAGRADRDPRAHQRGAGWLAAGRQRRAPPQERGRDDAALPRPRGCRRPHPGDRADRCAFSLDELAYEYPDEPVPTGTTPQQHLEALTWEGVAQCYPGGVPAKVRGALTHELALIAELDYAPYFLTVHDIVRFAKKEGHPLPGAGVRRQLRRLLLPRHHRRRSGADRPPVRALRLARAARAARHRCRLRTRAAGGGDPVHLRPLRPRARRAGRHRHQLPGAERGAGRGQGHGAVGGHRRSARRRDPGHAPGGRHHAAACARPVSTPADPLLRQTVALAGELIGFPRHLSQHVGGFVLTRGPLWRRSCPSATGR